MKIAFLFAAPNDLDVMSCNISNAYLNTPCKEKIWFIARLECGTSAGMVCKLTRALYELKSLGTTWWAMFSTFIKEGLGFTPTQINPNVYYRRNVKANGDHYYEYLLICVDDVLVVSHSPLTVMKDIGKGLYNF